MNKKTICGFMIVFVILFFGIFVGSANSLEKKQKDFVKNENYLTHEFLQKGMYACCLEKPCHTCLSLSPYHGEGGECDCLSDVVNGKSPCGECIGGILSGRGNKFLMPYFVDSLSEGLGEMEAIKRIIEEKYENEI